MRRLGFWIAGLAALAAVAMAPDEVKAQGGGAACPINGEAPRTISATSYTIRPDDICSVLVFTSPTPVAVTAPQANTVAPGFQIVMLSTGGGITVTPVVSTINGLVTAALVGQYQAGTIYGDGANYWFGIGNGFVTTAAPGAAFTNLSSVFPGTFLGNSPTVLVPNGVLQFINPASLQPAVNGDALRTCAGVAPPLGRTPDIVPAWLQVNDYLGRARRIPFC